MLTPQELANELYNNQELVESLDALKDADEAVQTINENIYHTLRGTAQEIGDYYTTKSAFSQFEKQYKKQRGLKHMPGNYRSAKSVILNALKNNVDLNDNPGKSDLEKRIKTEQKKQDKSLENELDQLFKKLENIDKKVADYQKDSFLCQSVINSIRKRIDSIEGNL